jgi:hypothetical protein
MFRLSRASYIGSCLLLFSLCVFYAPPWKGRGAGATIGWDASGYYLYLPSLFIYKDLKKLHFMPGILEQYHSTPALEQAFVHPSGNYVIKYTCGQALLYAPFFFIAHGFALASKAYPADGFSTPYQMAISLGMLLYSFAGLYFLRRLLLRYFSDVSTALTLLVIVFATNYLDYAGLGGALPHNTLFAVYALLLLATDNFYRAPRYREAAFIGLLVGLAALIRPTEIISFLLPLLWAFKGPASRVRFLWQHRGKIGISALFAGTVLCLQAIYWKAMTGSFLVYSYGNEGFNFRHPFIRECLFSYKAGWLVYTPVMLLAIIGFVGLYRRHKNIFWPTVIFSLLFCYLCFSWKAWWYGGGLGQRAMIQAYAVLALPIAALVQSSLMRKWSRTMLAVFVLFCTWYNLWLTHQAHRGGLFQPGEMNGAYFWSIFGKSAVDPQKLTLLDNDVLFDAHIADPVLLYKNNFETDTSGIVMMPEAIEGKSTYLDAQKQFTPEYFIPLPPPALRKLRAAADLRSNQKEWVPWKGPQMVIRFYRGDSIIQTNMARPHRLLSDGIRKRVYLDARVPAGTEKVTLLFWNADGDKRTIIDNIEVVSF